jgi:predicted ATPase
MLRKLNVENFMSLRNTTVDLSPLTIFIGPNASGKSAIFKALVTLSKLLHQFPVRGPQGEFALEPDVTLDHLVWRGNSGLPIIFRAWFADDVREEPSYTLELIKESRGWSVRREKIWLGSRWFDSSLEALEFPTERRGTITFSAPHRATISHLVYPYRNDEAARPIISPFLDFSERFGFCWRYRPSASDIATFFRHADTVETQERLPFVGENGVGLPAVLQRLQGQNRELFQAIEHQLSQIFPHIRFINFQSERLGVRLAFTTVRSEDLVPAPQESDGVLLTTFLLWRLFTAEPTLTTCIEEPENGAHPYFLKERYRLIHRFAYGDSGYPPVQLLVATHSPDFLSAIEQPAEAVDAVRLVEFDPTAGTKVYGLRDIAEISTLMSVFRDNLGDLWWSGAIGGVPNTFG